MYFAAERVNKILEDLNEQICSDDMLIENYKMKDGNYHSIEEVEKSSLSWTNFSAGDEWGGKDKHCWFRAKVVIPENFDGKTVALKFVTCEDGWDAVNPQLLVYVNGTVTQGVDQNHLETIIDDCTEKGKEYIVDVHAYSGMTDKKSKFEIKTVVLNKAVRKLYYDILIPLQVCHNLDDNDKRKVDMLKILNETINLIDLRKPYSKEYFTSVDSADEYIQKELYGKLCGKEDVTASCVGHTHIDVAWMWTLAQTHEKVARSFSTVLKLMQEYPEYIFMSSQPQLYKFLKDDYPEIYSRVKQRVKEGRWEPEGGMWLESDCNLTGGESLVRQLMFGKRFFKNEFGVNNEIVWLPDTFGFSAALPQIMKKAGIKYFMTTKISWNEFDKFPYDTFKWRGIDGSEVLAHFICTKEPNQGTDDPSSTYNGDTHPDSLMGGWKEYKQKELNSDILVSYGFGDGGGGTTRNMIETAERLEKGIPGCPKVKFSTAHDFYEKLEREVSTNKRLPRWDGELYFEFHRGTYTSMGRNKKFNRKSELKYQDAEALSSMAEILTGEIYPQNKLNSGWETILLNQFHDILPGSAIKEVYDVSKKQYIETLKSGREIVDNAISKISSNINLKEKSVVVFNTLSFVRSDLASFCLPDDMDSISIFDENNNEIPYQIENDNGCRNVIFFAENIPSKGYKTFKISAKSKQNESKMNISTSKMENDFYNISIDDHGTITSIYDKKKNREVIKNGCRANVLQVFEDKPTKFNNWNVDVFYQEKMWEADEVESIEVIDNGPVRGGIRITRKFLDSKIVQNIYIYKNVKRIDFDTYIDWKEKELLLKAAFPVDVHANKATYDIQFGNIERTTNTNTSWDAAQFEVCAHKWADVSEDGYGVSLMNDCKYGYDIKDGVMRLTLLKSGIDPNKEADKEEHRFVYSIYPHEGNWKAGHTALEAYSLNVPLYAKVEAAHEGKLSDNYSMIKTNCDNVIVETVKKAEDSSEFVIRMYEYCNRRTNVTVKFARELESAFECDLMEENDKKIPFNKDSFTIELKPYEIKTIKIK